jgi:rhodanese-related sulfurtransferase
VKAVSVSSLHGQRLIVVGLVAVLLLASVAVPQAFAQTSGNYENISVNEAYKMIKKARGNLVILDVRNHSEYNLGHLYDAVLIPVYELEERISELQEHVNDPIIVYCKAGSRSQIACEILTTNGFTKVYNMLGGITAWMEAGYPIYTTYHHVTVNVLDEEILLQIELLLLYQAGCTSCGCQSCGQNQNYNITPNIAITTLEQNETYTLTLVTYEVNDTAYEVAIAQTLLWNYNEASDEANRTAKFISTEITAEDTYMQFYSLSYIVQHAEYNLTLYTTLTPLESETYNSSFTIMNYAPAEKSVTSMEFVEFNSSVTLSQQYAILGKVAKEIGKVYEKSGDETLAQLAQGYYIMEKEANGLSKLVEKQLLKYNREILKSHALLMDASIWDCFSCGWEILTSYYWVAGCAGCIACIAPCWTIFTFWWCIGCLLVPCAICIWNLIGISRSCCLCAEYLGWIDCPLG